MIDARSLSCLISIRRNEEIDNGKGGYSSQWVEFCQAWAEVKGLNGRESVMERVLQGISAYRITIRWRSDLLQSDQIRYGDQDLNIRSISDPDGRRQALLIIADNESAMGTQ